MLSVSIAASLLLFCAAQCVLSAPIADRVHELPLLEAPLPSAHYSGYLKGLDGSFLHYYLVVASEVDPAVAPFVFWTNGGPGCSSMDGWGYELGPFHFKQYASTGPILRLNNYTWTKNATIAFVENPPGVGFSYRTDGNYTISDTENAANNYAALIDLLHNKFPEYLNNTVYIAGESYGGIYVPTLADVVLTKGRIPNFGGVIVGNGVTSATYDDNFYWSDARFAHGHGFLTDDQLADVKDACVPPRGNASGSSCNALQALYYTLMAPDINMYDYTLTCFVQPSLADLYLPAARRRLEALARHHGFERAYDYVVSLQVKNGTTPVPPSPPASLVPCIDSATMTSYLNRADVKAALHVEPSLVWGICAQINYVSNVFDVVHIYDKLVKAGKRVLIYNGNLDMSVPYTGTRAWIEHETTWTPTRTLQGWSFADAAYPFGPQQGGFAVEYEHGAVWFTLINGAGHMVPQFRPPAALAMFLRFISKVGF